ncbi:MAG: polysaccharide lyase family 8 super-sandwich domain-containing protein [Ferruginibacter sp.]
MLPIGLLLTSEELTVKKAWGMPGTTNFAGGVSDSVYGATAYDLNYDSVTAKKAWFFFDNEVVCLGAGINSNSPENITTTINQCWLKGNVKSVSFSGILKSNSIDSLKNPKWIWHDSIGYFFPSGGNIAVSNQTQSGEWYRINKSQPQEIVKGDVFKLWINHGTKPIDNSYEYIVVPAINNEKQMQTIYPLKNIKIEKNTAEVQAVSNTKLDMLQIVFYKGGNV